MATSAPPQSLPHRQVLTEFPGPMRGRSLAGQPGHHHVHHAVAGRGLDRLRLDRLPERQRERITLWQTALTYRDDRLRGFDAAVLMEVIEHVDPPRLPALEGAVFGHARPTTVVVTTPNVEYNARFEGLPAGAAYLVANAS